MHHKLIGLVTYPLFDINIKYDLGKTNKAPHSLSKCPVNAEFETEGDSENGSKVPVMLSTATIFETMCTVL